MHEANMPSPGKTAPRLLEDLLDYDPETSPKKAYHLLADPAPKFLSESTQIPPRRAERDCRHELLLKPNQSSPSLSAYEISDFHTPHIIAAYCSKCRYHYHITVDCAKTGIAFRDLCKLKNSNKPLHHFRYVRQKSKRGLHPNETSKYDGHVEEHYFKCSNTTCPVSITIRITPPRLSKEQMKLLGDPAKIKERRRAAEEYAARVLSKPDRFEGKPATQPGDVYFVLWLYLNDILTMKPEEPDRRILNSNKNFSLTIGTDCITILKWLDFTESVEVAEDGEELRYWNLPRFRNQEQYKFFQDAAIELLQKVSDRQSLYHEKVDVRFDYHPLPALKDIQRALGCWDYPRKSRQLDLTQSMEHPHYSSLGACEDFQDDYITYAYIKQCNCDEPNKPYYLDCLSGIANGRHSSELQVEVAKEETSGALRFCNILEAYNFFTLDPSTTEPDDHIIGLYRSRVESAPRQKDEARSCLRVIAKSRKSSKLEAIADDKSMSLAEAFEFLDGVPPTTAVDMLQAVAVAKVADGHKQQAVKALRVIANAMDKPELHVVATGFELSSEYSQGSSSGNCSSGGSGPSGPYDFITYEHALSVLQASEAYEDPWIVEYYRAQCNNPGKNKDELRAALRCIGLKRGSNLLLAMAHDENAKVARSAPSTGTAEHPVGLQNIGNTCYLNSLLQFYYTVKPVREIAMNFEDYRQDVEGNVSKRVGGQEVTKGEIVKAQRFVEELGTLYSNLKTASTPCVKPSTRLAELALFSTEADRQYQRESAISPRISPRISVSTLLNDSVPAENSPTNSQAQPAIAAPISGAVLSFDAFQKLSQAPQNPQAPSDLTPPNTPPTTPPVQESVDVEMTDQPSNTASFDQDDTSSETTLVNSDEIETSIINGELDSSMKRIPQEKKGNDLEATAQKSPNPELLVVRTPTPELDVIEGIDPTEDANKTNEPASSHTVERDLGLDAQKQEQPPPMPPRNKPEAINTRSANQKDKLHIGAQQDVTEVIQNVLFRMSCAIKPSRVDTENKDEQIDIIRDTFFGQSAVYLKKPGGWDSRVEDWNNLTIFPAAAPDTTRSIYEALDVYFDPQYVELGNQRVQQYAAIKVLPPILQILIQRTAYDKTTYQASKNENFIKPDETIYLDRYLDELHGSHIKTRRECAWEWKRKLKILEDRRDVLKASCAGMPVPSAMAKTTELLKRLQECEIPGFDVDESLIDNLEARQSELEIEVVELAAQISDLRKRLDDQFADLRKHKYTLQAVFMHRGSTSHGHYWIYIYDFASQRWREYNDERVTVIEEYRMIFERDNSKATPYYLVYVADDRKDELVDAVCRDVQAQAQAPSPITVWNPDDNRQGVQMSTAQEDEDQGFAKGQQVFINLAEFEASYKKELRDPEFMDRMRDYNYMDDDKRNFLTDLMPFPDKQTGEFLVKYDIPQCIGDKLVEDDGATAMHVEHVGYIEHRLPPRPVSPDVTSSGRDRLGRFQRTPKRSARPRSTSTDK